MLMPLALFFVCASFFVLPWIDRIFNEIAPTARASKIKGGMHLQLSDMLLTAVCYGIGLSVVLYFQPDESNGFVAGAAYLLVAEMMGLLAAMDVCRKTHYKNDLVQRSSIFLIFSLLFPLTLPAALLAWKRWSNGLSGRTAE